MIEKRLSNLENDVAVIKATMATKDDMHSLKESISNDMHNSTHEQNAKISDLHIKMAENQTSHIRWVVGTGIAIISAISVMTISVANTLVKAFGAQ